MTGPYFRDYEGFQLRVIPEGAKTPPTKIGDVLTAEQIDAIVQQEVASIAAKYRRQHVFYADCVRAILPDRADLVARNDGRFEVVSRVVWDRPPDSRSAAAGYGRSARSAPSLTSNHGPDPVNIPATPRSSILARFWRFSLIAAVVLFGLTPAAIPIVAVAYAMLSGRK